MVGIARAPYTGGCFVDLGHSEFGSKGPVWLNGIEIEPQQGGMLVMDLKDRLVKLTKPAIARFGAPDSKPAFWLPYLHITDIPNKQTWTPKQEEELPGAQEEEPDSSERGSEGRSAKKRGLGLMGGLPVSLGAALTFSSSAESGRGSTEAELEVGLPKEFSIPGLKGKLKDVSGVGSVTTTDEDGLSWRGGIKIGKASLLGLEIERAELSFESDGRWSLAGTIGLPGSNFGTQRKLHVEVGFKPASGGVELDLAGEAEDLNQPLFDGVFIQSLGLSGSFGVSGHGVDLAGAKFGLDGALSLGPKVSIGSWYSGTIAHVSGAGWLKLPGGSRQPVQYHIEGAGSIGSLQAGVLKVLVKSTGEMNFYGSLNLALPGGHSLIKAELANSWAYLGRSFNFEAHADIGGHGKISAVVSSGGAIVCFKLSDALPAVPVLRFVKSGINAGGLFGCDVGPVRLQQPKLAAGAHAAAAGQAIEVPAHARAFIVRLTGDSGPPKVTLTGPRGENLE
ncbi:MAG: hypothetical protein ACRDNS_12175, partial [Trebonia sp.]